MTKLTDLETKMLANIARNEFAPLNGGEPQTFQDCGEVWVNCLDCGPHEFRLPSIPGVVASLSKKGLIETDGETIGLTQAGFTAYKGAQS